MMDEEKKNTFLLEQNLKLVYMKPTSLAKIY